MKNIMKEQIISLFETHKYIATDGIWLSGYYEFGEFIQWFTNGNVFVRFFVDKTKNYIGEYKKRRNDGKIIIHKFYLKGGPEDLGIVIEDIEMLKKEYPQGPWL